MPQELPKRLLQVPPMLELQELELPMLKVRQERPQAETERQAWPSGSSDASRQILYEDAD